MYRLIVWGTGFVGQAVLRGRVEPGQFAAHRIEIRGQPNIEQETVFSDADTGEGNTGGCLATGMRAFNAIPAVCAARPGILSTLDLPLITGRGGMRAPARGAAS